MSLFGNIFAEGSKVPVTDLKKRFDLVARVGQGSMSKVWKATDSTSGKTVAVKVLDKEKTERFEKRFRDLKKPSEAEIATSLHHPNIVATYEFGMTPEKEIFLVMEYVEGAGLSLLVDLQNEQMTRYRTRYMIQIGEGLSHFHSKGWIHRDICPRNIMVSKENDIKLIDFGLAVPDTPPFRKPGNRTGTANYMAPELIKRQSTDQRIDVFSYAVTCYEMYAKRHPWDAAMTIDAVMQHINKPPIELKNLVPRVDDRIAEIIMKGLEINPADRWQTVSEMVAAFRECEKRLVKQTLQLLERRKAAAKSSSQKVAGSKPKSGSSASSAEDAASKAGSAVSAEPIAKKRPPKKTAPPPVDETASSDSEASSDDSDDDILSLD